MLINKRQPLCAEATTAYVYDGEDESGDDVHGRDVGWILCHPDTV